MIFSGLFIFQEYKVELEQVETALDQSIDKGKRTDLDLKMKKEEYLALKTQFDTQVLISYKVSHHPLQSTTPPSSKYHTTLFKVPHHPA